MTERQRQALLDLVAVYVRNAPQPTADGRADVDTGFNEVQ